MGDFYDKIPMAATTLIGLSIMLFVGFLVTRITKPLKLPNVTAYIFTGVLLGPVFRLVFKFDLIHPDVIKGMDFITDVALAFVAFGVGRFLKLDVMKQSGKEALIITLFESLLAALVVFLAMYFIFNIRLELALLLGAIASATSSTSTMMTIRETKSKGHFVNTILQVVSIDNAISLILFSISVAIITAVDSPSGFSAWLIVQPILLNIGVIVVGIISGFILKALITQSRSTDNRLIIVISILMAFSGIAAIFDISPLLGCMAMGMTYVNIAKDESLFRQVDYFSPPILTFFFVLSGMSLQLDTLLTIGLAGLVYFIVRIVGKYGGARLGSIVAKSTEENKKYLGLALIPQAGVSIGLAALGSRILASYGFHHDAAILTTVIIASGVLYEIFGPVSAKYSLYIAKAYDVEGYKELKANAK